jgi:hypothetical protein
MVDIKNNFKKINNIYFKKQLLLYYPTLCKDRQPFGILLAFLHYHFNNSRERNLKAREDALLLYLPFSKIFV